MKKPTHPFRRAVLRGLAMILPPLLTLVLFVWVWNAIESNVLVPVESRASDAIVWSMWDVKEEIPADVPLAAGSILVERSGRAVPLAVLFENDIPANLRSEDIADRGGKIVSFQQGGRTYRLVGDGAYVPADIVEYVTRHPSSAKIITAEDHYRRYVKLKYLNRWLVIPIFLCLFVLVLYLLGKFLAAGVGRMLWNLGESIVHRLPIIRNVYSSVKQVTDFLFTEQDLSFTRVVAVEYPRKGIWTLAFVTGEGMWDIRQAANEPVVSILVPTSPMPATGFTMTVKKSETVELDITIDQAIQFIVSCGVVVPAHQAPANRIQQEMAEKIARHEAVAAGAKE